VQYFSIGSTINTQIILKFFNGTAKLWCHLERCSGSGGIIPGMERRVILVALIEEKGRYLLTRQSSVGRQSGLWGFPGGNLEDDENDIEAALCREVKEEVGLFVTGRILLGAHVEVIPQKFQLIFFYYLAETRGSTVKLGREIDEYKWLDLERLENFHEEDIRPPYGWFREALKLLD
jgi:8-oxo-dGTP diphosphatase